MNKPAYILFSIAVFVFFSSTEQLKAQSNPLNSDLPNIFSPNGDGINDQMDFSNFNLTELIVSVYNRWGQKVFESNRTNTAWDGNNMKNVTCPDGVYYYVFDYVEFINKSIDKKGFIQLVR